MRSKMLQVSRGHICDLLSFCVRSHTFRMKYFVLRNNVVSAHARPGPARPTRVRACVRASVFFVGADRATRLVNEKTSKPLAGRQRT